MSDPKLERRLRRITAPTLVVAPSDDRLIPVEHAQRYAERIPGATYAEVPDCGHAMYFEKPAEFASVVDCLPECASPRRGRERSQPVKFSFFHLMPYPYLPDDFDTAYDSTSLTYPNANFDPSLGAALYARYLDELEYADQLGFDGIAVNEHHQSAYGLMPSPNLMAAALTRRTSRARIMVLGNAIGIRGNPLRVAEEIAMLDLMSGGRVDSGFVRGIGWEYFGHSINPTKSRSRFNEAHDLIIKAWTSPEMFSWYGENYEYRYVNIWPRPMQQPHPPIFIPGAGSTETMKFCAERRYTYMSVYAPTRIVRRWFDGYRQAAADLGYVADPEKIAFSVPIYVADTDEKAHAEARPAVEWLYHKGLKQTAADGDAARVHVARVAARRACLGDEAARRHLLRGPARPGAGGRRVAVLRGQAAGRALR